MCSTIVTSQTQQKAILLLLQLIDEFMSPGNKNAVIVCLLVTTMLLTATIVNFNATSENHAFTSVYGLVKSV